MPIYGYGSGGYFPTVTVDTLTVTANGSGIQILPPQSYGAMNGIYWQGAGSTPATCQLTFAGYGGGGQNSGLVLEPQATAAADCMIFMGNYPLSPLIYNNNPVPLGGNNYVEIADGFSVNFDVPYPDNSHNWAVNITTGSVGGVAVVGGTFYLPSLGNADPNWYGLYFGAIVSLCSTCDISAMDIQLGAGLSVLGWTFATTPPTSMVKGETITWIINPPTLQFIQRTP